VDVSHFVRGLEEAKAVTDARHVQLVLLLLGSENEIAPEHPYQKAMAVFAEANHVPIVNMIDVMRGQPQREMFQDHVPSHGGGTRIDCAAACLHGSSTGSYQTTCQTRSTNSPVTLLTTKSAVRSALIAKEEPAASSLIDRLSTEVDGTTRI